jgi:hypothetical protein
MVPHHWAQAASNVIQIAAKGGTAMVSKSRTDSFLSEANQNLFGSQGLLVRLVTSEVLLTTINFPLERAITLPLSANLPLDQQPTFHTRLLQGLRGYVSDTVPTSLPPRRGASNLLDKLSADQVARDIEKIDKKVMKESEKQMKHKKKMHQDTPSPTTAFDTDASPRKHIRSKSLERKMQKLEHDIEKVNMKAEKKLHSGKSSAARIEPERAEDLSPLLKKKEHLLEKEAKMQHVPD